MENKKNIFEYLTDVINQIKQDFEKNPDLCQQMIEEVIKANDGTINRAKKDTLSGMTAGIDKYIALKNERVAEAEKQLKEIVKKGNAAIAEWKKAVAEKDADTIVRLSSEVDQIRHEVSEQKKKVKEARESKAFPDGAVEEEWKKLCETISKDWTEAFHTLEYASKEYHRAAVKLIALNDIMRQARAVMMFKARQNGADPKLGHILTDKIDRNKADALLLADSNTQERIKAVYSGPEHTLI